MSRIVVLAWGNPSRGDDALGPEFLRRVETLAPAGTIDFVTDFQLAPEHAADLADHDLALFVDASLEAPPPYVFRAIVAARDRTFTTHAMSPEAVVATFGEAFATAPPPAFLLAIRGERFELGDDLSAAALRHLDAAVAFYRELVADSTVAAWSAAAARR
jgi:hydrogenase maturation protease